MFTIKNSTRNIVSLATLTSDDSRATLAILSVGTERLSGGIIEGKMLIDVALSADSEDTAAEVRTRVEDMFSNFHYEPKRAGNRPAERPGSQRQADRCDQGRDPELSGLGHLSRG
jgi:hypothetical protein